ncbi:lipopolysaccharide biosynthesis protein [Clostridium fungisolvens]|uniref:Lipopolysaccharide biosynthesis protein n=1 Tax=Clostridium fungisolvens TaxID=1604897 RepID=A0A6V8SAC0_9CLOT|nr:lipopolysaccharide biosynthesis protein [Clostridium fungisolvens]GFP74204.1 hypothetical protein bsdtw1_00249 [Clostridium fungisolvens]
MGVSSTLRKGILINFVSRYCNIFVQLIINSILARLLLPSEFGVVAIISVFTSFFAILGDMGIGPAIIQNKSLKDKEISDIFIFSIFASIIIAILFYFFSYFVSDFYGNKIYIKLGSMLSIAVLFNIANIVPNALLYKKKNFKIVGIINVSANIIVGCITITLAIKGWSYYALIFDSVLKSITIFLFSTLSSKVKIYRSFNITSIKKVKSYSTYQFLFNFINYFTRNLDNILVGKYLGVNTLAYYDKAYKLMLYPVQNLTYVITPVLHPILSDYQEDKKVIYNSYLKIVKLLSLLGVFASVFCFFSSKEIIFIMYGGQWTDSIIIFQILSLSMIFQMVLSSIGSIFQATGYVKKLFSTGIISSIFTITGILTGIITKNIVYLAIGISVAFICNFIQCFYVLLTDVFLGSFVAFLVNLKSTLIIFVLMAVGYSLFLAVSIENIYISVIVKLIIGFLTYSTGLLVTKEYKLFLGLFKRSNV